MLEVGLRDRTCVELCALQHIFILLLAYAGGPLADAASQARGHAIQLVNKKKILQLIKLSLFVFNKYNR